LVAYETARKEIKQFQESTLSQRISERAKYREAAIAKAHGFGKIKTTSHYFLNTIYS
jgi:hypothetical protein